MTAPKDRRVQQQIVSGNIWKVEFHDEFKSEFDLFSKPVRIELAARIIRLQQVGPQLGRPAVDTLKGSHFANMKELRFDADGGVWRVAFAFDPERRAIFLVGGDKAGVAKNRFYRNLIAVADRRFQQHLDKELDDGHSVRADISGILTRGTVCNSCARG